jgi:hypothetical protein
MQSFLTTRGLRLSHEKTRILSFKGPCDEICLGSIISNVATSVLWKKFHQEWRDQRAAMRTNEIPLQVQWNFIRSFMLPQLTHLLSTTPPRQIEELCQAIDDDVLSFIKEILRLSGDVSSELPLAQIRLKIAEGGCGMPSQIQRSVQLFATAKASASNAPVPEQTQPELHLPHTTPNWIADLKRPFCFLSIMPTSEGLVLSDLQFSYALRFRLQLIPPQLITGCNSTHIKPLADDCTTPGKYIDHVLRCSSCSGYAQNQRHESVNKSIASGLAHLGIVYSCDPHLPLFPTTVNLNNYLQRNGPDGLLVTAQGTIVTDVLVAHSTVTPGVVLDANAASARIREKKKKYSAFLDDTGAILAPLAFTSLGSPLQSTRDLLNSWIKATNPAANANGILMACSIAISRSIALFFQTRNRPSLALTPIASASPLPSPRRL